MKFKNSSERNKWIRDKLEATLNDQTLINAVGPEVIIRLKKILLTPVRNKAQRKEMMQSKIWRLNFIYNVVNKDKEQVPFVMNRSQFIVYLTLLKHKRIINLKSRQQGITTLWLIVFLDDCICYPDIHSGMISIGQKPQQNLLRRCNITLEYMEPWARQFINPQIKASNKAKEIEFKNNSVMEIASSFRGSTPNNLHISEMGEIAAMADKSKLDEVITGSIQGVPASGRVIIESTAKGENEFAKLYRDSESMLEVCDKDPNPTYPVDMLYPVFLSWLDDPDCQSDIVVPDIEAFDKYEEELKEQGLIITPKQKNFWISKYRIAGENIFREFPATVRDAFRISTEGTIFADHYKEFAHRDERLPHPYDSENSNWRRDLPVHVSFDIGIHDPTFMIWLQIVDGDKIMIIREHQLTDSGPADFSRYMRRFCKNNPDRDRTQPAYNYGKLILPHDSRRRNNDDELSTPKGLLEEKGWNCVVSDSRSTDDNVLIREIMSQIYIDTRACPLLDSAFMNYRKQYDRQHGTFKDKPEHDEYSHPMDSLRYGIKELYEELAVDSDWSNYTRPVI